MTDDAPVSLIRRGLFVVVLVVAFLFLGRTGFQKLAALAEDSKRSDTPPPPAMVRTQVAKHTPYQEALRGYGRPRAVRFTTVTAEVGGYVEFVDPKLEKGNGYRFELPKTSNGEGSPKTSRSTPGPRVIQLETFELADLLKRAEAEQKALQADVNRLVALAAIFQERIDLAQSELETAKRERDRVAQLVRGGKLTPSELDGEKLKVLLREQALKQLVWNKTENEKQQAVLAERKDSVAANVDIARRNLRRASIHIPIPGVIESREVNQGDTVTPNKVLFTVVDLSQVEVPIALPARFYADVDVGAEVTLVDVERDVIVHKGQIARKDARIDETERTFFVYVVVEGTPTSNVVTPGTYLRAELGGRKHEDVVVVPREAFAGKDLFVIVEDPEADPNAKPRRGKAKRITPAVSRWLVDVALVTGGLEDGQEIVTSNLEAVGNDTKLRIAPPVEPEAEESAR
ncbi:MAG: efflux RND transporter periplasmic adaptor subunit [Planctomycetota bacterium]|nr:efflux RND transporter periplasmic adaptor subunit [Planctomycetota bacterium]